MAVKEFMKLREEDTHTITLTVEFDREDDGRYIAEVIELPGVLAYGDTEDAAFKAVVPIACHVIADKLTHGELDDIQRPRITSGRTTSTGIIFRPAFA